MDDDPPLDHRSPKQKKELRKLSPGNKSSSLAKSHDQSKICTSPLLSNHTSMMFREETISFNALFEEDDEDAGKTKADSIAFLTGISLEPKKKKQASSSNQKSADVKSTQALTQSQTHTIPHSVSLISPLHHTSPFSETVHMIPLDTETKSETTVQPEAHPKGIVCPSCQRCLECGKSLKLRLKEKELQIPFEFPETGDKKDEICSFCRYDISIDMTNNMILEDDKEDLTNNALAFLTNINLSSERKLDDSNATKKKEIKGNDIVINCLVCSCPLYKLQRSDSTEIIQIPKEEAVKEPSVLSKKQKVKTVVEKTNYSPRKTRQSFVREEVFSKYYNNVINERRVVFCSNKIPYSCFSLGLHTKIVDEPSKQKKKQSDFSIKIVVPPLSELEKLSNAKIVPSNASLKGRDLVSISPSMFEKKRGISFGHLLNIDRKRREVSSEVSSPKSKPSNANSGTNYSIPIGTTEVSIGSPVSLQSQELTLSSLLPLEHSKKKKNERMVVPFTLSSSVESVSIPIENEMSIENESNSFQGIQFIIPPEFQIDDEIDFDNLDSSKLDSPYSSLNLDDPNLTRGRHKTVMSVQGWRTTVIPYVTHKEIKDELNQIFFDKFPQIRTQGFSLSKIRHKKKTTYKLAIKINLDAATLALAFVYAEKLILKGVISSVYSDLLFANCVLLAAKFNQFLSTKDVVGTIQALAKKFKVDQKDIIKTEFLVFSGLSFNLFPNEKDVLGHYDQICASIKKIKASKADKKAAKNMVKRFKAKH